MLYTLMEIGIGLLFLIVLADAVRHYDKNSKKLLLLVLALIYALLFENIRGYGHGWATRTCRDGSACLRTTS
jgi:hypothetical protein